MPSRPRLLFVHGSVVNGDHTWSAQRPLADRFDLVVPNRRGFPPNPPVDAVVFEDEARWLDHWIVPGTHLVGHSAGGLIALLAAARHADEVASLTVIEPPALDVARGDPVVDAYAEAAARHWRESPRDPETFLRGFLDYVGASQPPGRLTPELLQGARTLMVERPVWEVQVPIDELAAAPFPKLVVSGAHRDAFDEVCDVLERRLPAERAVLTGAGHSVQRLGAPFNDRLAAFVERASARA